MLALNVNIISNNCEVAGIKKKCQYSHEYQITPISSFLVWYVYALTI